MHRRKGTREVLDARRPWRRAFPSFSWNVIVSRRSTHVSMSVGEVLVVEERGIREARADDALVSADDRVGALGVAVVHDDERARERAVRRLDGEVALVRLHRGLEDLARHAQERLVEPPDRHRRILDEVHDLGERLLRRDGAPALALAATASTPSRMKRARSSASSTTRAALQRVESTRPRGGTSIGLELRKRWPHTRRPAVRPANSTGTTSGAEEREERAHGPDEAGVAAPPSLRLRPVQIARQRDASSSGSTSSAGQSLALDDGVDVLAAALLAADQVLDRDALAAGEALRGLRRRTVGVEGGLDRGALRPHLQIVLTLGQRGDHDAPAGEVRRTSRSSAYSSRASLSAFGGEVLQLRGGRVQRPGRHLLDADLEDEVACVIYATLPSARRAAGSAASPRTVLM